MAPVIFEPVIATVDEFINWSLTIVSLMIIWYVIKFFSVAPPTEEDKQKSKDEWEQKGAKMREWFGKKMTEREEKEKAATKAKKEKAKERKASVSIEGLRKAIEATERLDLHLSKGERKLVHKEIQELNRFMDEAWKNLQLLRKKHPEDSEKIDKIIGNLHASQKEFLKDVKGKLPKKIISANKDKWQNAVSEIEPLIGKIRGNLGSAFQEVRKLYK